MIVAIVGPTGVGKTKLSIELAKKYNAIIINCDAVQVYKELNIGSAKVTKEEMEGIPHYLIDFVNPNDNYTVYDYQKDIRIILEKEKGKNIIIVGGTGLYLKAALYDYKFVEESKGDSFENLSNEEIYELAIKKDPNCDIHPNNRKRLVRFLNKITNEVNSEPLYEAIYIGLTTERDILYKKINERVDKMIENGLLKEAEELFFKYPDSRILNNAIGYKELKKYLNNEIEYEAAIEEIKKNSRHYAKRQYTWFNNQMNIYWISVNYENFENTINNTIYYIERKCKI